MKKSEQGFNNPQPNQITKKIKFGLQRRVLANSKVSYIENKGININKKL